MGAGRGRRTGLILIVVIILLLLVGVVVIVALPSILGGGGGAAGGGTQPTAVPKPTTVKLIIAGHNIRRGTRLTEQDVATLDWPLLSTVPVPADTITVTDQAGLEQVTDRVSRIDIVQGQLVLNAMLTPASQPPQLGATGSDAALLIPPGMVAIAFPLNRNSSVAYALQSGDHVDVMMSFRFIDLDKDFQTKLPNAVTTFSGGTGFPGNPTDSTTIGLVTQGREDKGPFGVSVLAVAGEPDQRPRQTTQLVISNVIVMRLGDWPLNGEESVVVTAAPAQASAATPAPGPTAAAAGPTAVPPAPDIITLVMSRQDALVLKYSLEVGADIDFALRSAYDSDAKANVKTDSVTLQYIFDTYNVAQPPRLPIGFEPSIDIVINPTGEFQQGVSATAAPKK